MRTANEIGFAPQGNAPSTLSRRECFKLGSAYAATSCLPWMSAFDRLEGKDGNDKVAFFFLSDTHYYANENAPQHLDDSSRAVTRGLVETLNRLPGTEIPAEAGGGCVAEPRGVINGGDLIDSGDKQGTKFEAMQVTEWEAYTADFGIDGTDGILQYPVFEVHGNHDSPDGRGYAIDGIIARNRRRKGLTGVSENGLHCSWDWGGIQFLNLGIVVGSVSDRTQRRRYAPMESLEFLQADLEQHVGTSGRPVVITHHIDIARYSLPCNETDETNMNHEWHPCDVRGYYEAIQASNVVAILHGHTHVRNTLFWDGESTRVDQGLAIFNADNASHFSGGKQAFFYFELDWRELVVRECFTADFWRSYQWTPQVWRRSMNRH